MKNFITCLLFAPFCILLTGWVFKVMWGWFMVPIFSLPSLSFWQAYGLSLVAGLFNGSAKYEKVDDDKEELFKLIVGKFVYYIIFILGTLLFGFIIKSLV